MRLYCELNVTESWLPGIFFRDTSGRILPYEEMKEEGDGKTVRYAVYVRMTSTTHGMRAICETSFGPPPFQIDTNNFHDDSVPALSQNCYLGHLLIGMLDIGLQ